MKNLICSYLRIFVLTLSLCSLSRVALAASQSLDSQDIVFGSHRGNATLKYLRSSTKGEVLESSTVTCPMAMNISWQLHLLDIPFSSIECGQAWNTGNDRMIHWQVQNGKVFEEGREIGFIDSQQQIQVDFFTIQDVVIRNEGVDAFCQITRAPAQKIKLQSHLKYRIRKISDSAFQFERIFVKDRLATTFEIPARNCPPIQVTRVERENWSLSADLSLTAPQALRIDSLSQ